MDLQQPLPTPVPYPPQAPTPMFVTRMDTHAHWIAAAIVIAGFFIGLGIYLAGCSIARSNRNGGMNDQRMMRGAVTKQYQNDDRDQPRMMMQRQMMPMQGDDDVRFEEPPVLQ